MSKLVKLKESDVINMTKKILNEIILPDFFQEIKMMHNMHYRQRLKREHEPRIVKMTDFGVFGADNIALAEMDNDCYIFIDKRGRYKYELGMSPSKLNKPEYVAGFFNSMLNYPKYKKVVELYDGCKAKVLDIKNDVYIIDTTNGRESSLNAPISKYCYNFSSFKSDEILKRETEKIERDSKQLIKREPSGEEEIMPLKFRIREELLKIRK